MLIDYCEIKMRQILSAMSIHIRLKGQPRDDLGQGHPQPLHTPYTYTEPETYNNSGFL